ncbi:MAG: flagellar FlbD family protein [Armatimonadetes bacterium]|nr:flagellar FlbD family protein [Armatimonadota bacterium]
MITLTQINGYPIVVNVDLIETMEATPDTHITLVTGQRIIVREDIKEVIERVVEYRRRSAPPGTHLWPDWPDPGPRIAAREPAE